MGGKVIKARRLLTLMLLVGCAWSASAQQAAIQWRSGLSEINQGWAEHDGDNLTWAQSTFDDSGWTEVDLEDMGPAQPGWRWFRKRVPLAPDHPHVHLLIAAGEGTYELYVNGQKQPGPELGSAATVKRPSERVISLPDSEGDLQIALRTHTPRIYTTWHLPLFLSVTLGRPTAIEYERQALQSQRLYAALTAIAINLLIILAGIGMFALYGSQRKQSEYLWLALYLVLLGTSNLLLGCTESGIAPLAFNNLAADPLVYFFTILQIQFTFSFAGKQMGVFWRTYEAVLLAPLLLNGLMFAGLIPSSVYLVIEGLIVLPAALLLPVFLLTWWRRGNREAGWLILPSLLPLATTSVLNLGTASSYAGWGFADFLEDPIALGPITLSPADLGDFLFLLAIGVVMFFRFTRVSREQARSAAELDAAREIQQRLVPRTLPALSGCRIEAAYLPADEVGGDFYQVLPQPDGSTLIAIGDVSGKGLKAAMTGALAIGALRTLASEGLGPATILERLNAELVRAQNDGFITCFCAALRPNGQLRFANAGHLAPYCNGVELATAGSLPLGISAEAQYEEAALLLEHGDQLTFLSDGVVEAQNATGELFGFERTQGLSSRGARELAEAARDFGQADDITVLTLTRLAAVQLVGEGSTVPVSALKPPSQPENCCQESRTIHSE